ncbi:DUF1761 domain-containing protein [Demequina aurantiaca]|uniref:DUF1761 domain-containing protein n=1 Tax=Demequina aurantiaca TaxID=676200 RepID=UPI003D3361DD
MEWFSLDSVNWLAVLAATIASFVVGYLWYRPALFGRERMKQLSLRGKDGGGDGGSWGRHAAVGVVILLTALVMNMLMVALGVGSVAGGAAFGLVLGAVFRLGTHLIHNGFALRGHRATLIDGAQDVVSLGVVGAVIAAFL